MVTSAHKVSRTAALLAAWAFAIAAGPGWAGTTTVFKCFDRSLNVVYTDQPCRGEQMDIKTAEADPVALAELQREREALSRSAAQRIADNRRATLARDLSPPGYYGMPPEGPYAENEVYYPAGYGVAPGYQDRRRRPDAGVHADRRERITYAPPPRSGLGRK